MCGGCNFDADSQSTALRLHAVVELETLSLPGSNSDVAENLRLLITSRKLARVNRVAFPGILNEFQEVLKTAEWGLKEFLKLNKFEQSYEFWKSRNVFK